MSANRRAAAVPFRATPRRRGRLLVILLLLAAGLGLAAVPAPVAQQARTALMLEVEGAIGPATARYLSGGLEEAAERGAALVVLRMDTPGGLDTSMREIIRDILASPVPVATYVTPSGARAASAGTYILYASHIAAMTPGTNLGAATPVAIGGGGLPFGGSPDQDQPDQPDQPGSGEGGGNGEDAGTAAEQQPQPRRPANASEAKAINDAVAYIRSLAELRGRNADWAEAAVRQSVSLAAGDALARKVIDIVAPTLDDMLAQANGRIVQVAHAELVLDTEALEVERLDPDWRIRLLAAITNPNVALILMMIGFYGLIFEFMNPGALYPGTIGAICLILGLYSLAALPVNYAGIGLMALGVALIVGEAFSPSFGVLGIGGAVALVLGATMLMDTDLPAFQIAWPVIAGIGVTSAAFALLVMRLAVISRRRQVVSGREHMIGMRAVVLDWSGGGGFVRCLGERWQAVSDTPLEPGQQVRVKNLDGLTLSVEPIRPKSPAPRESS